MMSEHEVTYRNKTKWGLKDRRVYNSYMPW